MSKPLKPAKRWFSEQQELNRSLVNAVKTMAVTKEPITNVEEFLVRALVGSGDEHKAEAEKLKARLGEMEEKKIRMEAEIKALAERSAI